MIKINLEITFYVFESNFIFITIYFDWMLNTFKLFFTDNKVTVINIDPKSFYNVKKNLKLREE